jgi:hypothetical protein
MSSAVAECDVSFLLAVEVDVVDQSEGERGLQVVFGNEFFGKCRR